MNTLLRVGGSCALGALVGTIIALLVKPWWCWVGTLAGGSIAYLTCDWKNVVESIPKAWEAATSWEINWSTTRRWGVSVFCAFVPIFSLCFYLYLALYLLGQIDPMLCLYASLGIAGFLGTVIGSARMSTDSTLGMFPPFTAKQDVLFFNPVTAPFTTLFFALKGLWWYVQGVPSVLKILCLFLWKLFVLIHSEIRIICFLGAFLGAAIGAWVGLHYEVFRIALVVGTTSGAILGVISYWGISIRWLKLKPA